MSRSHVRSEEQAAEGTDAGLAHGMVRNSWLVKSEWQSGWIMLGLANYTKDS